MAQPAEVAPYRLVEIEDKGRGLVAAKDLEVGDLVFEEKAFLKLPSKAELSFYKTELSRLEPDIQAKLMNLSYAENANLNNLDESAILLKKFNSNCFEVEDNNALVQEAAVFEMLSMINHSCKSNVMYFSEEADTQATEEGKVEELGL